MKRHVFSVENRVRIVEIDTDDIVNEFEVSAYPKQPEGRPVIHYAKLSNDGRRLATTGSDASGAWDLAAHVWDISTGELQFTLEGFQERITSLQWLPGDESIVTVSADRVIRFWDPKNGKSQFKLTDVQDPLVSISASPDGTLLAVVTESGQCRLWNYETREFVLKFPVFPAGCGTPTWSPDGKVLAFGTAHGTVQLHAAETGRQLGTIMTWPGGPVSIFSTAGHFRRVGDSRYSEEEFVFVVEDSEGGQQTLDRVEMHSRYGWINDLIAVSLAPEHAGE